MTSEVVEFLQGERAPFEYDADLLAGLLFCESLRNPAWSRLSRKQWREEVDKAIAEGSLIEDSNKKLAAPSFDRRESKSNQLELF